MTLDDPNAIVMGKEPILNGERVLGYVTSANYGYTVGKAILYGYLPVDHTVEGTSVEVEYFGRRYRATVAREPLYDPKNLKLKS
jgi:glycine cleavage system aminomethyltransferase T